MCVGSLTQTHTHPKHILSKLDGSDFCPEKRAINSNAFKTPYDGRAIEKNEL